MADIWVNILGDSSKLKGELDKAGGHISSFSEKLGKIGKIATVGGAAVTAAFTKTFIDFTSYEEKLIDMAKVTDEPFDQIKAKLGEIDPVLGSSKDLLSSYYQVISAGVKDPVEALDTLTVSLQAGKAAHTATSEVVKGITKMMAGYEGAIKDASVAADLLFSIEKEGQTSVAELIPYIGGLAKVSFDLNIKQEALAASLAVISKTAGSTGEAATQYEAILTGLMKPTETMKDAIKAMGYESAELAIKEEGLVEVLKFLEKYTGGSSEALAELFGRKEAMMGFSALGAEGFKTLDDTIVSVGEGIGGAKKAFDEWSESGAASIDTVKNSLLNFSAKTGEQLAPMIKDILGSISNVIAKVTEWTEENPKLFETIVKVAAVIGGLAAVGGPILMAVSAFSAVAPAIALIGTIATGPIGLLIIAVTAIIAIWRNWDKIVEFVSGFVEKIIGFLIDLKDKVLEKIKGMIDFIFAGFERLTALIDKVRGWGRSISEALGNGMSEGNPRIDKAIDEVVETIAKPIRSRSPIQYGELRDLHKWGMNIPGELGRGITDGLDLVLEPLKYTGEKMEETVNNTISSIGDLISDLRAAMVSGLSDAFYSVLSGAKTFGEAMKDLWKSMIDAILQQIAKLAASWIIKLVFGFAGFNTGGLVKGFEFGGEVKKYQFGGSADTVMAKLDIGEYVISKPMTDFIRKFKAIPQNLIEAVSRGLPTPIPAFAGGGPVGTSGITAQGFGETKINIDIHDNRISDNVDIKRLAVTISDEVLRKIEMKRRH